VFPSCQKRVTNCLLIGVVLVTDNGKSTYLYNHLNESIGVYRKVLKFEVIFNTANLRKYVPLNVYNCIR
jgi:hypothetical protein